MTHERTQGWKSSKFGPVLVLVLSWIVCVCGRVSEARERVRMIFMIIALGGDEVEYICVNHVWITVLRMYGLVACSWI